MKDRRFNLSSTIKIAAITLRLHRGTFSEAKVYISAEFVTSIEFDFTNYKLLKLIK